MCPLVHVRRTRRRLFGEVFVKRLLLIPVLASAVLSQMMYSSPAPSLYSYLWVSPGVEDLRTVRSAIEKRIVPESWEYAQNLDPLHNIHREIGPMHHPGETWDAYLNRVTATPSWGSYWEELTVGLGNRVFAVMALRGEGLAGYVRFYPGNLSRLRTDTTDRSRDERVLVIGAGCVDDIAARDSVGAGLLRQVVEHAKREGFTAVVGVGWSDVRSFATWGEQLTISDYTAAGFSPTEKVPLDSVAAADIRAGRHGPNEASRMDSAIRDKGMPWVLTGAVMKLECR